MSLPPTSTFAAHIADVAGKALAAANPTMAVPRALILERAREADWIAERLRAGSGGNAAFINQIALKLEERAAKLRGLAERIV